MYYVIGVASSQVQLIARHFARRRTDHRRGQRAVGEEVRGYAAPMKLCRQPTNIADVWREAWTSLENLRSGRVVLLREEVKGIDLVSEVDAFAVGQVFRNIFENAIVACQDPCEIVVS